MRCRSFSFENLVFINVFGVSTKLSFLKISGIISKKYSVLGDTMYKELYTEKVEDIGRITYYDNKSVRVFWTINPESVSGTRYSFSNELIEVSVDFIKSPKYVVTLETFIKPQFKQVKGIRQNIKSYCVKIKKKYENGVPVIATPYNKQEDTKVNLCRHPSKNRSKHGAKTEVNQVYKAGGMRPK